MENKTLSYYRYTLLSYRLEQIWLPLGLMALFVILTLIIQEPEKDFDLARGFLGFILPLMGGVMGAYAVLDDQILELHFSTPRPVWHMLADRLGLALVILTIFAGLYQGFLALAGVDVSALGNLGLRQLAWLVPTVALTVFGAFWAIFLVQATPAALMVGFVWTLQAMIYRWFLEQPVLRFVFLFIGVIRPEAEVLGWTYLSLMGLSGLLLAASIMMLKKNERYL